MTNKGLFEWTNFNKIIPHFGSKRIVNKSLISSNFVASLELAKNGFIELDDSKPGLGIELSQKYLNEFDIEI